MYTYVQALAGSELEVMADPATMDETENEELEEEVEEEEEEEEEGEDKEEDLSGVARPSGPRIFRGR